MGAGQSDSSPCPTPGCCEPCSQCGWRRQTPLPHHHVPWCFCTPSLPLMAQSQWLWLPLPRHSSGGALAVPGLGHSSVHGSSHGSQPQPIPTWWLSQPANPVLPPGPSSLMQHPPMTTKQHCGLTNHVLPPGTTPQPTTCCHLSLLLPHPCSSCPPITARGGCVEPIRSCCLPLAQLIGAATPCQEL